MSFLTGYKTYITAVIGVILTGALAMGYIDQAMYTEVAGFLGFLGLGFLRAGVSNG